MDNVLIYYYSCARARTVGTHTHTRTLFDLNPVSYLSVDTRDLAFEFIFFFLYFSRSIGSHYLDLYSLS